MYILFYQIVTKELPPPSIFVRQKIQPFRHIDVLLKFIVVHQFKTSFHFRSRLQKFVHQFRVDVPGPVDGGGRRRERGGSGLQRQQPPSPTTAATAMPMAAVAVAMPVAVPVPGMPGVPGMPVFGVLAF
jgi:hypothetical protein